MIRGERPLAWNDFLMVSTVSNVRKYVRHGKFQHPMWNICVDCDHLRLDAMVLSLLELFWLVFVWSEQMFAIYTRYSRQQNTHVNTIQYTSIGARGPIYLSSEILVHDFNKIFLSTPVDPHSPGARSAHESALTRYLVTLVEFLICEKATDLRSLIHETVKSIRAKKEKKNTHSS